MTFNNINHFKRSAEFFPAGKIIPQRILKGPRRFKHNVTFGSNSWALRTSDGYVIASDTRESGLFIRIRWVKDANFLGSPYTSNGGTYWIGNSVGGDDEWLNLINERVYEYGEKP